MQIQQDGVQLYQSAVVNEVGTLRLILPSPNRDYSDLYINSHAERIFEHLAGQKSYDFITTS